MAISKFTMKASVAAVAAVLSSGAWAVVDLDTATATHKIYAQELAYVDATPLPAHANINMTSKIGFGVSAGQDRYIRINLTNATLDAAFTTLNVAEGVTDDATEVVVQGGAIGDSYVIVQITAGTDLTAAAVATATMPALRVTSTGSNVGVSFQLHETAVSAVAGSTGSALLYSNSGTLASFASGLYFDLTPGTNTAIVADAFKTFTGSATTVALGEIEYGAGTDGTNTIYGHTANTAVTLGALVQATTNIVLAGDFGAAASANGVFIDADGGCGDVNHAFALNAGKTQGTFAIDTTALAAGAELCYTVSGTTVIPGQTMTAALDVTAATGTTTADVAAGTVGTIDHDGTTLQSPWFSTADGYISRFVLTNTGSAAAAYTATVVTESGNTCTSGSAATGTLAAEAQTVISAADVCSSFSGATRAAVIFDVEAANSNIQGVYNIVNATTGSIGVSNMMRPGTN